MKRPGREYRVFGVWDIETSVTYDEAGHPIDTWLSYGVIGVYLSRNGHPAFRRLFTTWDEFRECLEQIVRLTGGREFVLFAHNFAFEGDFLIKHIGGVKHIVANGVHRPISIVLNDFPSIVFRCSWKLIDESVKKIGERVGLPKLEGDYSPMARGEKPDQKRVEYCTRDCDIVALGIAPYVQEYKNIWGVPLTKTGIVRGMLRDLCKELDPNRDWDFIPPQYIYDVMRAAFYGGIAIANPRFVGLVVSGVLSFDESSAYPFAALTELYPRKMTEGDTKDWKPGGWWIAKLKFVNVKTKYDWGWLPGSRMDADEWALKYNGKIIESREVIATVCNVDFENICKTYTFDRVECLGFYPLSDVQKLPEPIYQLFERLAKRKQSLKIEYKKNPTPENKMAYSKAKERFNSLYGMMVQAIATEEYIVNERGEWSVIEQEIEQTRKHLCRNYLFGVFITAYARQNLLNFYVKNAGNDLIFGDTDSGKIKDTGREIVNTNAEKMKLLDRDLVGNLGEWEQESFRVSDDPADTRETVRIDRFKTYGAKKYWYAVGETTHITVAGLPAKNPDGTPIDTSEDAFHLGHTWEKCKLARSFLYFGKAVTIDEESNELCSLPCPEDAGGVALYPVGYTLDITKTDRRYIKIKYGRDVI